MPSEFGDVVLVPFPFTSQAASKKRPAVVVSNKAYNTARPDVVVMAITSQFLGGNGCAEESQLFAPGEDEGDVAARELRAQRPDGGNCGGATDAIVEAAGVCAATRERAIFFRDGDEVAEIRRDYVWCDLDRADFDAERRDFFRAARADIEVITRGGWSAASSATGLAACCGVLLRGCVGRGSCCIRRGRRGCLRRTAT